MSKRKGDMGKGVLRKFTMYECWNCGAKFCAKHSSGHAFNTGHRAFHTAGKNAKCAVRNCDEIIVNPSL